MPVQQTRTATTLDRSKGQQKALRRKYLSGEIEPFATTLLLLLTDHFEGLEWMDWEPDVLGQEIQEDFGVEMPAGVRDKLWALVTTLKTDRFYNDPLFFNHVANALMDEPLSMQVWEPAEPEEMAWAMIEVGLNDLDDNEQMVFSDEIKVFIGEVLRKEGVEPYPPLDSVVTPQFEGAPIPDDLELAAQYHQERLEDRDEALGELESRVSALHEQKNSLQIPART